MSWKLALLPVAGGMLTVALAGPRPAEEKPEDAAAVAAEAWLESVDEARYGRSWEDAAALFKKAVTKDQWSTAARNARKPIGRLLSRKLKSRELRKSLPGAPEGEYVVIQYDSSFANMKTAVETIVPARDPDGVWRVSGYSVK